MTCSIIARDPGSGHVGLAMASGFFAIGPVVPYIQADCAVATQAFINPMYGVEGLRRLRAGEPGDAILRDLLRRDRTASQRQVHLLDSAGRFLAFTGDGCAGWAGHSIGRDCSVAGNMLAGPEVVFATLEAYEAGDGLRLPERLLCAMEAGERAGGDRRGRQSAALRVHRGEDYAWTDIRADDHPDPLGELRRLMAVAEERYLAVADTFATRADFTGRMDRATAEAAIRAAEERRRAAGPRQPLARLAAPAFRHDATPHRTARAGTGNLTAAGRGPTAAPTAAPG